MFRRERRCVGWRHRRRPNVVRRGPALDAREPQVFDGSDVREQPCRLAIGLRVTLQRLGDDRVGPSHVIDE